MYGNSGGAGSGSFPVSVMRRYRARLMTCTAIVGGIAAGLGGAPSAVFAQCAVTANPNTVSCSVSTTTTNTTNTDAATANSSDRQQTFDTGGNVTATIGSGVTVTGFGLAITNTQTATGTNGDINFTNAGTVTVTAGSTPSAGGNSVLNITATGNITYTGSWDHQRCRSGSDRGDVQLERRQHRRRRQRKCVRSTRHHLGRIRHRRQYDRRISDHCRYE